MAAKPIVINCIVYPKNKSVPPYPATIAGLAYDPTLSVGGGPIDPGIEIPPDAIIWPNPPEGIAPIPEHPIVLPPEPPPVEIPDPPPPVAKPGWNWAPGWSQWIWVAIPGEGQAQPKGGRR